MGFLPINIFMIVLFAVFIFWGWDGEEMRQFFAIISSIFMLPLWFFPLYSLTSDNGSCCTIAITNNWLPTFILGNILFWNTVLMYWTTAHLMETAGREDPIGKWLKRLRKAR